MWFVRVIFFEGLHKVALDRVSVVQEGGGWSLRVSKVQDQI